MMAGPGLQDLPYAAPADDGLDLVYLDAALLVVNKPAGLLSVPGRGEEKQDCLARRVQAAYREALALGWSPGQGSGLFAHLGEHAGAHETAT